MGEGILAVRFYYSGELVAELETSSMIPIVGDHVVALHNLYRVGSRTWYLEDGIVVVNLVDGLALL